MNQLITITPHAAKRIAAVCEEKRYDEQEALYISIVNGGCAGSKYNFSIAKRDVSDLAGVVEQHGATVIIDPSAIIFTIGATLDVRVSDFYVGFHLVNPNEIASCGCAESVSLKKYEPLH